MYKIILDFGESNENNRPVLLARFTELETAVKEIKKAAFFSDICGRFRGIPKDKAKYFLPETFEHLAILSPSGDYVRFRRASNVLRRYFEIVENFERGEIDKVQDFIYTRNAYALQSLYFEAFTSFLDEDLEAIYFNSKFDKLKA